MVFVSTVTHSVAAGVLRLPHSAANRLAAESRLDLGIGAESGRTGQSWAEGGGQQDHRVCLGS